MLRCTVCSWLGVGQNKRLKLTGRSEVVAIHSHVGRDRMSLIQLISKNLVGKHTLCLTKLCFPNEWLLQGNGIK